MLQSPKFLIYALIDPRTLLIRYIGKSTSGLYRAKAHRYASGRATCTYSANWIRELREAGFEYTIAVLDTCNAPESLADLERYWIAFGRACGWPLTNLTDGGEGVPGHRKTEETRKRIGDANRGRKRSPETRDRMREIAQNRSPEVRARMGASAAARPHEMYAAIGLQLRGRKASPELRAKLSQSKLGHPVSAETRAKISEAVRRTKALQREQRQQHQQG